MLQLLGIGSGENARQNAPTENLATDQPATPIGDTTRHDPVAPRVVEQQERDPETDFHVERQTTEPSRAPKQWRQSLGKLDDIEPKKWAEKGVKPIRNVPKEFQAQYREILSDLLGDHAQARGLGESEAS